MRRLGSHALQDYQKSSVKAEQRWKQLVYDFIRLDDCDGSYGRDLDALEVVAVHWERKLVD